MEGVFKGFSKFHLTSSKQNTGCFCQTLKGVFQTALDVSLVLVINIDNVLHHSRGLTVQCAQVGTGNVWVSVC